MIGLLVTIFFLKHNINISIHVFFLQLFLLLFTFYWSKQKFCHHSKIRSCITTAFYLIESIKHCDDLNNESQYLCLQLNCLNQIKCHKNHFLCLKLILLLSEDVSLSPGPIQNDHLKENWKTFRSRGIHFIHLNIISLLPKIDELTKNSKNIKPNGYWHCRNKNR